MWGRERRALFVTPNAFVESRAAVEKASVASRFRVSAQRQSHGHERERDPLVGRRSGRIFFVSLVNGFCCELVKDHQLSRRFRCFELRASPPYSVFPAVFFLRSRCCAVVSLVVAPRGRDTPALPCCLVFRLCFTLPLCPAPALCFLSSPACRPRSVQTREYRATWLWRRMN